MSIHVFRVIVRGRFAALDPENRAALLEAVDEHEALRAKFTKEGTLTYDRRIDFFSFRYEIRIQGDDVSGDGSAEAYEAGMEQARRDLDRLGLAHRDLRATGSDLTRVWD